MSSKLRPPISTRPPRTRFTLVVLCAVFTAVAVLACNVYLSYASTATSGSHVQRIPINANQIIGQCAHLKAIPGPPANFYAREVSDRYEPGTGPTHIRNATIWTGARNGTEVVYGDVYLEKGIIKGIGYIPQRLLDSADSLTIVDAKGGWVTPGLVDLHSHAGIFSTPVMMGAFDQDSPHGPIVPWLRSIDGFNTHDESFELIIAGGVTSVQMLPASGNAIGGQAFMMKLRKTSEHSPTSMLLEPPYILNGTDADPNLPLHWRHLKQACGENLRTYGTRMDTMWSFRQAYGEARKVKNAQDDFCAKAEAGLWNEIQGRDYPENLQWEVLVDVLRGRVKISNHCYEAVDLDDIVRLSQEFQFSIASFHHASEAWLVPDVLKRTWGGTPAVAMFASMARYKREAYRSSQFAPRVLADHDIPVVMKSDHPAGNGRYVLYQAQQAHYFGLSPQLALSSVTAVPAIAAGLSHRIGILREGADADVVLWDTHPLQLGATPRKVWIDGILQVGSDEEGVVIGKGKNGTEWQEVPQVPNWDEERKEAVKWEGLPPLQTKKVNGRVAFQNVASLWVRNGGNVEPRFTRVDGSGTNVIMESGRITCVGKVCELEVRDAEVVLDLHGGSISPSLLSFGSPLGVEEILVEPSTGDGPLYDPLLRDVPRILGDKGGLVRTVDTLRFSTRNALMAYHAGVTYATSSLIPTMMMQNELTASLSATFSTGSAHALEPNAIVKPITALHLRVAHPGPLSVLDGVKEVSLSTQIAVLRRLLLDGESDNTETGFWYKKAADGEIPLVVTVNSADVMATLLRLKNEIEEKRGSFMRMVFAQATEAHLLAAEIAKAKVGVILDPVRPMPRVWDEHRILPGPPLTNDTALVTLLNHGVIVGIGIREAWEANIQRFDAAWAGLESNGRIDEKSAHALLSTNLEKLLGLEGWIGNDGDLVAYDGGNVFDLSSKVVAISSPERGLVDIFV